MLDTVKMLLGIEDDTQNKLLNFYIKEAESLVLGYCHIEDIPLALENTVAAIAADMYRAKGYGKADAPEDIKAMSEGQRSVTFDSKRPTDADILANYYKRLKPYRNLRGRVPSDV